MKPTKCAYVSGKEQNLIKYDYNTNHVFFIKFSDKSLSPHFVQMHNAYRGPCTCMGFNCVKVVVSVSLICHPIADANQLLFILALSFTFFVNLISPSWPINHII